MVATVRQQLEAVERLIREGKSAEARAGLERLGKRKEVPRPICVKFANLAWRVGLPKLGTRVLNPLVRPTRLQPATATDREKAEYAACLSRLGAYDEAWELLSAIPRGSVSELPLYQAFVLATRWGYREMIPLLREYLSSGRPPSYQRLVAGANLAAALVHERQHRQAEGVLRDLIYETSLRRNYLLLGVSYELAAVNQIFMGRLAAAEKILAEAERKFDDLTNIDAFFVQKWRGLLGFVREKGADRKSLEQVRAAALERGHWETLRDCDRFEAVVTGDEALLGRVYFGTPYESFRARLLQDFPRKVQIPSRFVWSSRRGSGRSLSLDLTPGASEDLARSPLLYRLLLALFSDFYRPLRAPTLHARIFPGEYFNPLSSAHRVHEAVRRLRRWLETQGHPIAIHESEGAYQVVAQAPCSVVIPGNPDSEESRFPEIQLLKNQFATGEFSSLEASTALGMTTRSTQRILQAAWQEGKLVRTGKARAVRYRLAG